ncbi:unnamed protein product [Blepharisma stoltei]|uniref:Uncharacterized protein n=1 Tax=Blepharisma stoltei TaxID=1481888 RepID=A0AAU9JLX0_9CILI|nr:unnamed protein product [Blepharisma stoltei]
MNQQLILIGVNLAPSPQIRGQESSTSITDSSIQNKSILNEFHKAIVENTTPEIDMSSINCNGLDDFTA